MLQRFDLWWLWDRIFRQERLDSVDLYKTEGVLSSLAAILVLFTTMLDPRISVGLAVAFLLGLGIYHFVRKN
jgi:hypothetical protein